MKKTNTLNITDSAPKDETDLDAKNDLRELVGHGNSTITGAHYLVIVQTKRKARLKQARRALIAKKSRQQNRRAGFGR